MKHETKMICVLGAAGGGRDKWKRPVMGKIAARYCSEIILTDEDPYDESPEYILNDIEEGVKSFKFPSFVHPLPQATELRRKVSADRQVSGFTKILDRRDAIKKALRFAKPNDIVVITGKGAEPLFMTKHGGIPWDDREVVREEIQKL